LSESANIEILAEGFNIFNRTQVTGVNTTQYTATSVTNSADLNLKLNTVSSTNLTPTFGTTNAAGATVFRERQIQFAARFEF